MNQYQILDWDRHYENNKSRERNRCSFCCIPNKQDGLSYNRLIRMPEGEALYGAFVAIVLMASKQNMPRNGHLTDNGLPDGCPLSARDVSDKTRVREEIIQKMLDAVSSENIGWILRFERNAVPALSQGSNLSLPSKCPQGALEGKKGKKEGKESPPALSKVDRISFERELKSIGKELGTCGELKDYAVGTKKYNRVKQLLDRQTELRAKLGVVA